MDGTHARLRCSNSQAINHALGEAGHADVTANAEGARLSLEPAAVRLEGAAAITSLSTRTLKRLAASKEVWGVRHVGRCLLFDVTELRAWISAGCPKTPRAR